MRNARIRIIDTLGSARVRRPALSWRKFNVLFRRGFTVRLNLGHGSGLATLNARLDAPARRSANRPCLAYALARVRRLRGPVDIRTTSSGGGPSTIGGCWSGSSISRIRLRIDSSATASVWIATVVSAGRI